LLQRDSNLTPYQIKSILENGALDLGDAGKDVRYGSGLVDLSNVDNVVIEEPVGDNYQLIIPAFEINEKNEITLIYNNTFAERKLFKVIFNLEELDKDNKKEFTKSIGSGDSKEFKYKIELELHGKHLLKIDVYSGNELIQSIEAVVDVSPDVVIEDKLAGVSLR